MNSTIFIAVYVSHGMSERLYGMYAVQSQSDKLNALCAVVRELRLQQML